MKKLILALILISSINAMGQEEETTKKFDLSGTRDIFCRYRRIFSWYGKCYS